MTNADESKVTRPAAEAGAVEPVAMKPCPWCGGGVGPVVEEGARFRWRRVTGCCADGPEVRHDTMADDQAAAEVESRAAAIAAWNNRPVEDTLRAQLEAAQQVIAEAATTCGQAQARAEAAEADAARYRWLRVNEQDRCDAFLAGAYEDLDAAIDAARTKEAAP